MCWMRLQISTSVHPSLFGHHWFFYRLENPFFKTQWHGWPVFVVENMDLRDVEVANISGWFANNNSRSPSQSRHAHNCRGIFIL